MNFRYRASTYTLVLIGLGYASVRAEPPRAPNAEQEQLFRSYQEFKDCLTAISQVADPAERNERLDSLWEKLRSSDQVPYAQGKCVAFLYRGDADCVTWVGDFNNWNPNAATWHGRRLAGTDLWILDKTFPADTRVDYKLVANGDQWMLDPANPLQSWSGFGPNSELRMPAYQFPQETVRRPAAPRGKIFENVKLASDSLGYDVHYRVYAPADYDRRQLKNLPVVYVADGHEYAADHLGGMAVVLDNLIAERSLAPLLAVFIDPRDPATSDNRRHAEYAQNSKFAAFVADELVPAVDAAYRTRRASDGRAILGTSLGGLCAAHVGAAHPDVFGKVAVQSPASFERFAPDTLGLYASQPLQKKLKLYVTAGTMGDGRGGVELAKVLEEHRYDFTFVEVNQGHSWGAWRGLLKGMLTELFGPAPSP
jgi:enterochelin esterase-like enzyme